MTDAADIVSLEDQPTAPRRTRALNGRRRRLYLEALYRGDSVSAACRAAGVTYGAVQYAKARDEAFAENERIAYAVGTDSLEQEATRRGRDGVQRPIMYQGQPCYEQELIEQIDEDTGERQQAWQLKLDETGQPIPIVETTYSDNMLRFVLEARSPERYRPAQRHELTGAGGGPIKTEVTVNFVAPAEVAEPLLVSGDD